MPLSKVPRGRERQRADQVFGLFLARRQLCRLGSQVHGCQAQPEPEPLLRVVQIEVKILGQAAHPIPDGVVVHVEAGAIAEMGDSPTPRSSRADSNSGSRLRAHWP